MPAILCGAALAFARAVGEFGSVVLISRQHPVPDRRSSSVYIFKQIESDNADRRGGGLGRPAGVSLVVLLADPRSSSGWGSRHDALSQPLAASRCASSRSATSALLLLVPVGVVLYRTFEHGVGAVCDSITTPGGDQRVLADDRGRGDRRAAQHDLRDRSRRSRSCAAASAARRCSTRSSTCRSPISPVVVGLSLVLLYGRTGWLGPGSPTRASRSSSRCPASSWRRSSSRCRSSRARSRRCCARSATSRSRPPRRSARARWQTFWRDHAARRSAGASPTASCSSIARAIGEFGAVSVVVRQDRRRDRDADAARREALRRTSTCAGAYAGVGAAGRDRAGDAARS